MKHSLHIVQAICAAVFFCTFRIGAAADQESLATNPVIPGFNPDPSVCRAGDDYYLATSSFEYFPGVPIYHSRDLAHWEMVGHALSTREQLDLTGVRPSGGIFAPTLRFHNGVFYMINVLIGSPLHKGIFVVTATDPAGPWSMPHWIEGARGIDPSLFFDDDGTAWLCANRSPEKKVHDKHREIWIQKLNLETFQLEGPEGTLDSGPYFANGRLGSVNNFEAPHLYKKNGWYYLMLSHGGTSLNHAVSIWRSKSPLGHWEENPSNPILTHRGEHPSGLTCTGHADLVEIGDGTWWMVLLGVRDDKGKSPMGRETFLTPVDWSGPWPLVNPGSHSGRVDLLFTPPKLATSPVLPPGFKTDFKESVLSKQWNFIRTPRSDQWELKNRLGWLTLRLGPEQLTGDGQPGFLGIRVTQPSFRAETRVDFQPWDESGCAGLAILRSPTACFLLVIERKGEDRVASVYQGIDLRALMTIPGQGPIDLSMDLKNNLLTFSVREQSGEWKALLQELDASTLSTDEGGRFTGSMIGLYGSSRGKISEESSSFDFFDYSPDQH